MANDAYRNAKKRIKKALQSGATELHLNQMGLIEVPESLGRLTQLQTLNLHHNQLPALPEWLGQLTQLQTLHVNSNELTALPNSLSQLRRLKKLGIHFNNLGTLPDWIGSYEELETLFVGGLALTSLPTWITQLVQLRTLYANSNQLTELPAGLAQLPHLATLGLNDNPLNPELGAVYKQGLDAVKDYLRAKAEASVVLNEAKLILIGEGEVGKSCLLDALRDEPWQKHVSTHGIEIKPVVVTVADDVREGEAPAEPHTGESDETDNTARQEPRPLQTITLNAWDFGGQKVYRPTHQLFFSAPAVYLVVWKPREGPQQGAVEYWIETIKHRAGPEAKILVVATHRGPRQRQPDIDPQDLRDKFGAETILGFFHVDSKPDKVTGERSGIDELKTAIASVAAGLPHVGREVATSWTRVLDAVRKRSKDDPYITYEQFEEICDAESASGMAKTYAGMLNELGHVIHYSGDDELARIMILKPDWLAKAVSFVLDDKTTRERHGLVDHEHLSRLWSDPGYEDEAGYDEALHLLFRRLMERFDLCYEVALRSSAGGTSGTSLIAQLVPDARPELTDWGDEPAEGDEQQVQLCRIVEVERDQSAGAEGLLYRLIVRLHRYSLGRDDYEKSVHWQRGLLLDDGYNGRALLEHVGNDVRITVRAAYPGFLLYELTKEVAWLVDDPREGWAGLRCDVMVPCIEPCGLATPGRGLFEVGKLKDSKRQGRPTYPCTVSGCNEWQEIDCLLLNAPATRTDGDDLLTAGQAEILGQLKKIRRELGVVDKNAHLRFRKLDKNDRQILSRIDQRFDDLMQAFADEAKDGPRLFSFEPVNRSRFNPKNWTSEKFRLTLWCEQARVPLTALNEPGDKRGVYELELTREWVRKAAPYLKGLATTLSLVLPVASAATKLFMDDAAYKRIEKELDFGQKCADSFLKGGEKVGSWMARGDSADLEKGGATRAEGSVLRELHAMLKEKDPGFGGLARVQNKRREFLWVHPQFAGEY